MTDLPDGAPPRGLEERVRDARGLLESGVDLWVATSGPAGPHLVPLSYLWDGSTLLLATARTSATARNVLADGRVRLALGRTRDVVMVDGTAIPVDLADLPTGTGDAFAARTGFDPRELGGRYVYLQVRPRRLQAWREENEIAGRDVMRDGRWLA
ncbi:pyridoxamine 5'-phosphate oxidase family protein [Actinotalea sp. K2]|uniref:pyridoxamine 5'-phosphate oxidase family protein n=1 Tax=Actinotalea sp. K2 TaxID=2939438 RepID=UPI002017EAC9|nr:pyridoxamine 5'-phosphate oxidase family protein [Actinotalea sp. K2]MCL3861182.1 pyridoxamine 5'-phosphate oxidase family protein [Actinotalea sp. K2]